MNAAEVASKLRRFILERSNFDDPDFLKDDTDLLSAGVLDSLVIVNMVAFCEDTFDCPLDIDDMTEEHFSSINNLAAYIAAKLPSQTQEGGPA